VEVVPPTRPEPLPSPSPSSARGSGAAAGTDDGGRGGTVREAFASLLGAGAVEPGSARWAVAGSAPSAVVLPASEEEVAACLRLASERGWRVAPAGAGTWLAAGNPLRHIDAVLSVRRLDRIVQYEPADLTLTAGAGMSLAEADRLVGREKQWLPLDPPGAEDGTLGATLATGSVGGLSMSYGAPRDLVLGVHLVTGDGRTLRFGGGVVKNVAGFDMVRLAVGSWGTLGVITEACFRLFPRPHRQLCLIARGERLEALVEGARRVATAPFLPAAVELLERTGSGSHTTSAALVVRLVGIPERVESEARTLEARLAPLQVERASIGEGDADAGAVSLLAEIRGSGEPGELVLRMALPASELPELLAIARAVGRLQPGWDELARTSHVVVVDALRGTLRLELGHVRTSPPWDGAWTERLGELRGTLERRGGSLTIQSGPEAIVGPVGAWGPWGAESRLVARLKEQFDPAGALSPGRWVFPDV